MTSTAGIRAVTLALLAALVPAALAEARPRAGSIDRSFGENGRVVVNLPGERMRLAAMTVQPDGSVLLGGTLTDSGEQYPYTIFGRAVVIRLLRDGSLDESFGQAGVARVRLPLPVAITGIGTQPDGAVLLSGVALRVEARDDHAAVIRLSGSGSVDESFGDRGLATVAAENLMPPRSTQAYGLEEIAVHPDGRILATGSQQAYDVHSRADPLIVRFLPNGTPDPSFDENGVARAGGLNQTAILARPDGDLVTLGWNVNYFGDSTLTALRVPQAAAGFPGPAPIPGGQYDWPVPITGLAARLEPDGSILYAARLEPLRDGHYVVRVRIGSDLEVLERGRRPALPGAVGTFDPRGALLTADSDVPIQLRRFRPPRMRTDHSFRNGPRQPAIAVDTELIGWEMQGENRVLLAGSPRSFPIDPTTSVPLTLFRLHAHQDSAGPIVIVRGLPRRGRCADAPLDPLVRIRDESLIRASIRLDRRTRFTRRRKRFRIPIETTNLRPGPHKLVVRAHDAAGNLGAFGTTFRVCPR